MSKWVAIVCCSIFAVYAQDAEVASFEKDDISMEMVVEMEVEAPSVEVAVEVAVEAPAAE